MSRVFTQLQNRGIRFNRSRRGEGASRIHSLLFTFINAPNLPNIPDRFDMMATNIQRRIRWYFAPAVTEGHPFIIEFQPSENRAVGSRQQTVRSANSITGEFLMRIYESILQSQEGIDIDGFRVYFFIFLFFYVIDCCANYWSTHA